jgi:hypothetical protein
MNGDSQYLYQQFFEKNLDVGCATISLLVKNQVM